MAKVSVYAPVRGIARVEVEVENPDDHAQITAALAQGKHGALEDATCIEIDEAALAAGWDFDI
jgi:hypothetical protein